MLFYPCNEAHLIALTKLLALKCPSRLRLYFISQTKTRQLKSHTENPAIYTRVASRPRKWALGLEREATGNASSEELAYERPTWFGET